MQEYNVNVIINDQAACVSADNEGSVSMRVPDGTTIADLAAKFQDYYEDDIILGMVHGKLREINKLIKSDCNLSFVTVADRDGRRTYRRSVVLLLQRAVLEVYGPNADLNVLHSLGEGYYCEIVMPDDDAVPADAVGKTHSGAESTDDEGKVCSGAASTGDEGKVCDGIVSIYGAEVTYRKPESYDIDGLLQSMRSLVEKDITITKRSEKTNTAEELFQSRRMYDKAKLLHYRRSSRVNLYELDGVIDYFYGFMAPSTGSLKYFDILPYERGFVILFHGYGSKKVEQLDT